MAQVQINWTLVEDIVGRYFSIRAFFWSGRIVASAIHLGISCCVAACAAFLVFGVWYPAPYQDVAGGKVLFGLMVVVDILLGPLVTLMVFNQRKSRMTLRRDLIAIATLQLVALSYGLWTAFIARPVHLVFEGDRFRLVAAVDVPTELLSKTPPGITALPLDGPTTLSLRPFRNSGERMDVTLAAMQGLQLGVRPDLWQPYDLAIPEIVRIAGTLSELRKRFPGDSARIDTALKNNSVDVLYLPLVGRDTFWTALLDSRNANVIAILPMDSF